MELFRCRANREPVPSFRQQPARRTNAHSRRQSPRAGASRFNVSFEDIQSAALPALRHRLIPNFEAEAEGITTDHIIEQILRDVPVSPEAVNA